MASAYGIVHQYGEPQSNFDPQLAAGVLQHKQQKYDANIVKVEQTLGKLGLTTSMLARPEDQKYLTEKVSNLINSIPNAKDIDYSSNEATREILSQVNQAVDDKVVKQLGESKKLRDLQAGIQKLKEDNPEKYSNRNYQDALRQGKVNEYMSGQTDSLGNLSYTPYIDPNRELQKKIAEAKKNIGTFTKQIKQPDGTLVEKEVSNMTTSEWMAYMPNLITPDMEAQLKINGRAKYNWNDEAAKQQVEQSKNNAISVHKEKIDRINSIIHTKDISDKEEKKLRKEIKNHKNLIKQTEEYYNAQDPNATTLGYAEEFNKLVRDNAALVGSDPSIRYENLPEGSADKREDLLPDFITSSSFIDTDIEDTELEDFEKRQQTASSNLDVTLNRGKETLKSYSEDEQEGFRKRVNKAVEKGSTKKQAEANVLIDIFQKKGEYTKADAIVSSLTKLEQENAVLEKANKDFTTNENFINNADGLFEASYTENAADSSLKIIGENGQEYTSRQYLEEEKGIETKEDFKEFLQDEERSKQYKINVLADQFNKYKNSSGIKDTKALKHYFTALNNLMGTNYSFNESYEANEVERVGGLLSSFTGNNASETIFKEKSENSVTNIIEKRDTYRNKSVFNNDVFSDDNFIENNFDYDSPSYQENYTEALKTGFIEVVTPKKITVQGADGTKEERSKYRKEMQALVDDPLSGGEFEYEKDKSTTIYIDPSNPNKVILSQSNTLTDKQYLELDENDKEKLKSRNTASIELSQFKQLAPKLSQLIDFTDIKKQVNVNANYTKEKDEIVYPNATKNREKFEKHLDYFKNPAITTYSFSDETKRAFRRKHADLYQAGLGEVVMDKALENVDRFKLKLDKKGDSKYVKVLFDTDSSEDEEYIDLFDLGNMRDVSEEEMLKYLNLTPQAFISFSLDRMATDFKNDGYNIDDEENPFVILYNNLNENKQ